MRLFRQGRKKSTVAICRIGLTSIRCGTTDTVPSVRFLIRVSMGIFLFGVTAMQTFAVLGNTIGLPRLSVRVARPAKKQDDVLLKKLDLDKIPQLGMKLAYSKKEPWTITVQDVTRGGWAQALGVRNATEIVFVNGRNVTKMTKAEFKKVQTRTFKKRPLQIQVRLPGMDPRVLTNDICACESAMGILQTISPYVDEPIFNSYHIGASFHRLAVHKQSFTDDVKHSPVLKRLIRRTTRTLEVNILTTYGVSNVIWAIAKLSFHEDAIIFRCMFPTLARAVRAQSIEMKPQDVSNVLWSIARLPDDVATFRNTFPALADAVLATLNDMKPQAVANVLWSIARLPDDVATFRDTFPALADAVLATTIKMKPQDVANVLLSIAALHHDVATFQHTFPALAEAVLATLIDMKPQAVANVFWSIARLPDDVTTFQHTFPALAEALLGTSTRMNPVEMSQVLLSINKLREYVAIFRSTFPALVKAARAALPEMSAHEVGIVRWMEKC